MFAFFMLCDEDCLVLHGCHVERNFHFFYEFVPAAQKYSAFGILYRVVGILGFSW